MAQNVIIKGYVWCDFHGSVHSAETPFADEAVDCNWKVWKVVKMGKACSKPKPKIKPFSDEWEKKANELARSEVIIHPCYTCHGPVVQGYVCPCGEESPGQDGYDEWTYQ